MAGQDLNRSIKIYIDGSEASQGIKPVQDAIAKLEQKLSALNQTEADYEEKSKELKKQLETKHRTLNNYQKKVEETQRVLKDLSGATYKELLSVQKSVRKELQKAVPGTEQYTRALEQNRRVSAAIVLAQREMRTEVGVNGSLFSRSAAAFNQYSGMIASSIAALTGLAMTMRGSVQAFAEMEEAESQVIKYTGMTKAEVKDLNEELKQMDTRTSREKLNALAGDAGKLGITAKEDVLAFVDAADKINVALGEDLGENAVANIGKLAQMFGEDERMGLRGAMLATGSAINEVAQNSSAAEKYLVEFAARVAGVAHQAGISQSNIIGFAASMDENMLRNETSATAYQNILLKMMQDTEKFAKVAGLNLQEFSKLVRTDANEALLTFASALGEKGGMADIAGIFGDLNTEGAGVASMLSVLAGKADEVRERQLLANQAYEDGTSILNEFNVQNNTVQAGLDKSKKGFNEVSILLGERLKPLMSGMISGTSLLIRSMLVVVDTMIKYKNTIALLSAAITAYVIVLQSQVMWSKLVALWNDKILVGMKRLYTVLVAHPWMAVAGACMTLVAYMRDLNNISNETSYSQRVLKKVLSETDLAYRNEQQELNNLLKIARDKTATDEDRINAINRLKEVSNGYLEGLTLETINTQEADAAVKRYTSSILANIKAKSLQQKIEELERAKQELKENPDNATAWYDPLTTGFAKITSDAERVGNAVRTFFTKGNFEGWYEQTQMQQNYATSAMEAWRKRYTSEMSKLNETQKALQDELEKTIKESLSLDQHNSTTPPTRATISSVIEPDIQKDKKVDELKVAISAENALYSQQLSDLKELYLSQQDEQMKTYEDYLEAAEQLEIIHLQRTLEISGLDAEARMKIEQQLLDFKLKCQREFEESEKKSSQQQLKREKTDTKSIETEYRKRYGKMKSYADEFGTVVGEVLIGQRKALEAFGDVMIDVVFDVLDQLITAKLNELAASAATATAEGTMKEISSKGIAGIGTSAMITAAVSGLLMTAKTALKGLLGKRGGDSHVSNSGNVSTRVPVNQYAAGKYDVIGSDDGRLYRDVPYLGGGFTGIVTRPALISEQGGELIISADDLRRLQQHINYPLVLDAIADARRGTTPAVPVVQYASGKYDEIGSTDGNPAGYTVMNNLVAVLKQLIEEGIPASVVLSDLERKRKMRDRARRIGSKNRKNNKL